MTINADLLAILVCPKSKRPLTVAPDKRVAKLNASIAKGGVRTVGGKTVERAVAGGLLTEDGTILYPIVDDIPVLLVDEGITLAAAEAG
ncbi:MAG: hypothetical protein ACI9OJ_002751 [Myxococcota bacterium]|jgi:uncharacterized protein YbaR (Trm112 family)